ncbi:ribosome-associated protein [Marinitoga hydrogenitolerans DSM 16785]|uniref:Ribosomal silencing factor RsfS n=1 Tax=Marinitoga hydrogenitolerans (strain DSM 16785 / JCM 12826 / AT1271) TaxID=1122195 RepID=A0A1M4WZQ8_MARH1|nr:ribosome silencing factor [Marinitoga hydrogenitolerans]SHE86746.1 ribosome-associated protein [Marinitoga hydrogenitolerans DSM 16785]
MKLKSEEEIFELTKEIVKILDEKDAINIKVLNMKNSPLIVDYFVIATGNSETHLNALKDAVIEKFKEKNHKLLYFDKDRGYEWLIVDGGSIVVHIFTENAREFYDLEGLWSEAEKIDIQ